MNNKNIIIGALVVVAAVFIILFVDKVPNPLVIQTPPIESEVVGAVSGPEISGDSFTVNGITTWTLNSAFLTVGTATSTLCNLPIPTTATTTTEDFTINFTTGPTATREFDFGMGLTPNATNTVWGRDVLTLNVPVSFQASTTVKNKLPNGYGGLTSGKRYLTAKLDTATTTTRGNCTAIIRELN